MSNLGDLSRLMAEVTAEATIQNYVEMRGSPHVLPDGDRRPKKAGARGAGQSASTDPFWIESPLPFDEFVVSPQQMNQPPLSERQRSDIEKFLGVDPKKVFLEPETHYREAVLLWGKGSGKDWLSSLVQCWIIYILLCMRNPRAVLRMPVGESTDIVNVAYSKDQAEDVFFSKFTGRLTNWDWLSHRYLIIDGGSARNRDRHANLHRKQAEADNRVINIATDLVEFPFGIRAHSKHAQNESWEGLNILFAVMDEASAFRDKGLRANAIAVHGTLRSSAKRFPSLFRIMILSWPRKKRADFTIKAYEDAIEGKTGDIYASKAAVWEVNPKARREDYAEDYRQDPEGSAAKYECNPPASDIGFLDETMVADCFIPGMESRVHTVPCVVRGDPVVTPTGQREVREYIGKKIEDVIVLGLTDRSTPRVIAMDGGAVSDCGAMCIAHGVPEEVTHTPADGSPQTVSIVNKVVVDALLLWEPDRERRLQVSLNNMTDIVIQVAQLVSVRAVSYDHWQSYSSIETLVGKGIYCEAHNVNADDYGLLKYMVNMQKLLIPTDLWCAWERAQVELSDLERRLTPTGQFKVDHPDSGSKDIADTIAQVTRLLNSPAIRSIAQERTRPAILIGQGISGGRSPISVARPSGIASGTLTGSSSGGTFDSIIDGLRADSRRTMSAPAPKAGGVQMPPTPGGEVRTPFPRIMTVRLR